MLAVLALAPAAASAAEPTVELRAPARGTVDSSLVVELVAKGTSVAAWEAVLGVRGAEFAGVEQPGATSAVAPLGPIIRDGTIQLGGYTCDVSRCLAGAAPVAPKAAKGVVARITLLPRHPGRYVVRLGGVRLVDRAGRAFTIRNAGSAVIQVGDSATVRRGGTAGATGSGGATARRSVDFTGDRRVDAGDVSEVGLAWETLRATRSTCAPGALASRDLNRDGCVDVADVQAAARGVSRTATRALKAPPLTMVVNSEGDQGDATINRVCATSTGVCTLRAAIQEANANTGPDRIEFNIPGGGVRTIQITSGLPSIADNTGGVTIDGYTQPGSSVNTAALASNAQIRVQIRGTGYNQAYTAFTVFSRDNVLRGLSIFETQAIALAGANSRNNRIMGSYVGTNAAGTAGAASTLQLQSGIEIGNGSSNNVIGTSDLADRNVISGNAFTGIYFLASGTNGTVIQNNIIGLNPSGTDRLRNRRMGIDINTGASFNVIGGLGAREGNVLSGNQAGGVEMSHPTNTSNNRVLGNVIGADLAGITEPAYTHNSEQGVHIEDTSNTNEVRGNVIGGNFFGGVEIEGNGVRFNVIADNLIGVGRTGIPMGNDAFGISIRLHARDMTITGNTIAFSPVGIQLIDSDNDSNRISRNAIYGNTGLGIDLAPLGVVNPNDVNDVDGGANQGMNFPVIDPASSSTTVSGTSCASCTVEVFRADGPAGANGEGRVFLGSTTASPLGAFSVPVAGMFGGDVVTATATDGAGNTSEFSQNVALDGDPAPPPPSSASDNFNRVVVDGWGSAVSGGPWSLGSGAADYDVDGNRGTIAVPAAGNNGYRFAFLGDLAVTNTDISGTISPNRMATGSSMYVGYGARRQANGQEYRFRLRLSNSGSVSIQAAVANGLAETFLGGEVNVGFTYTAGMVIRFRVQATGSSPTTLRMKAWPDGQPEPAGFAYTATDSTGALQGAGSVGVWTRLSSTATSVPTVFSFDDLLVQ